MTSKEELKEKQRLGVKQYNRQRTKSSKKKVMQNQIIPIEKKLCELENG